MRSFHAYNTTANAAVRKIRCFTSFEIIACACYGEVNLTQRFDKRQRKNNHAMNTAKMNYAPLAPFNQEKHPEGCFSWLRKIFDNLCRALFQHAFAAFSIERHTGLQLFGNLIGKLAL